jgi:hypothetical protein
MELELPMEFFVMNFTFNWCSSDLDLDRQFEVFSYFIPRILNFQAFSIAITHSLLLVLELLDIRVVFPTTGTGLIK